jgi:hypothetical protein
MSDQQHTEEVITMQHPSNDPSNSTAKQDVAENKRGTDCQVLMGNYNSSDKGRARHRRYNVSEKGRARYERYWYAVQSDITRRVPRELADRRRKALKRIADREAQL